ncbi:hypothetical protein [Deinococcus sp.]|uniref:hypothetical protein n=1 Tax=Deinococcus sp. TaxID=47478 RepID=UPI002869A4AF|nr:hypothetical protein [Deinococcus sp.]
MAGLISLSFMDGFLMARTLLGDAREQALSAWDTRLGEDFASMRAEYAGAKAGFREEIAYTEDFVRSVPELESWFTGVAFVLLADEGYARRLESLEGTELGRVGWQFQAIFEGFIRAGPLGLRQPSRQADRELLPLFRNAMETFVKELRRYGLRRRLDYVGSILGALEGVARGATPPGKPDLTA